MKNELKVKVIPRKAEVFMWVYQWRMNWKLTLTLASSFFPFLYQWRMNWKLIITWILPSCDFTSINEEWIERLPDVWGFPLLPLLCINEEWIERPLLRSPHHDTLSRYQWRMNWKGIHVLSRWICSCLVSMKNELKVFWVKDLPGDVDEEVSMKNELKVPPDVMSELVNVPGINEEWIESRLSPTGWSRAETVSMKNELKASSSSTTSPRVYFCINEEWIERQRQRRHWI